MEHRISNDKPQVTNRCDHSILDFPDEILVHIISYLSKEDAFWTMGLTCKRFFSMSCEFNTVIEITDNIELDKNKNKLDYLLLFLEVIQSVTHLVVWSYPEDYVNLNDSLYQNFRKFPRNERQYYIEKRPLIIADSGLTLLLKIQDDRQENNHKLKSFIRILKFAKKCVNLEGFYWKATTDFRNRKLSLSIGKEEIADTKGVRKTLYEIISSAKGLKYLTLCVWNDPYMINPINSISSTLNNLQVLDLTFSTALTDESISRIASYCTNLKHIDISLCYKITDEGVRSFQNLTNLEGLILSGCNNVTDDGLEVILENLLMLKYLDLSWCRNLTSRCLINWVSFPKNLSSILLNHCELIDDNGITCLSICCTHLRVIEVEGCKKLTDKSLIAISENCRTLKILNLNCIENITDNGIHAVCINCVALNVLELKDGKCITAQGFENISSYCKNIIVLDLKCCLQLTYKCVEDIVKNCSTLKILDIRWGCDGFCLGKIKNLIQSKPDLLACYTIGRKGMNESSEESFSCRYREMRCFINQKVNPHFEMFIINN